MCQHTNTRRSAPTCYSHPVSRDENPAAHGSITYTETCKSCGAYRVINANGPHLEWSTWIVYKAHDPREDAHYR